MAEQEYRGLLTNIRADGEREVLLPITDKACVRGMEGVDAHVVSQANPHNVTAAQIGALLAAEKGRAEGVATLGRDGKVPPGQLPVLWMPLSGGTMGGSVNMGGNSLTGLPNPAAQGDAATKGYADTKATILTGSYIGTGTYGPSTPNTIIFPSGFELLFFGCALETDNVVSAGPDFTWFPGLKGRNVSTDSARPIYISVLGNSMEFYGEINARFQLNDNGRTYRWVAMGVFK